MKLLHQQKHVSVYQSALYMTNSIIIDTPELILIVDPNWLPDEVVSIRQAVDQIRGDRQLYLLFTHSDYDHILGYGAFPDACVIASQQLADQDTHYKEKVLEEIRQFDDDYYLIRSYPILYPHVDIPINKDDYVLEIGSTKLYFYLATGHTNDGMMTFIQPGGILIAGDYLSDIEFPYIYHSSSAYLETLAKAAMIIEQHKPILLIPGHGNMTIDQSEMQQRRLDSERYIIQLRQAVKSAHKSDIDAYDNHFPFPRNMLRYHEQNRQLIEKECTHNK